MQLAASLLQFACSWQPPCFNLHANVGHLCSIYIRLAAIFVHFAFNDGQPADTPLKFACHEGAFEDVKACYFLR